MSPLVSASDLFARLSDPDLVIVDCRFDLADGAAGRRAYLAGHIPGAVYAHLDDDLSSPVPVTDAGRHPLPTVARMGEVFGRFGITSTSHVVVYDSVGGAYAGRLWWMLRYLGHAAVSLLDGGWQGWQAAGYAVRSGEEVRESADFQPRPHPDQLVLLADVPDQPLLVDSRDPQRYAGLVEPIDPRAGHIPGAVNFPFARNLDAHGRFLPAETVREQFRALLGDHPPQEAVFYCGSGVSACLNLVAMAHAGLPPGRLYVGSWSEWSADVNRPADLTIL
jgi:thiosulfate/3-mercaptopyruvate sulfurtransferase